MKVEHEYDPRTPQASSHCQAIARFIMKADMQASNDCYFERGAKLFSPMSIEYGIFGEGSHISINQKRESTVFSLLIG